MPNKFMGPKKLRPIGQVKQALKALTPCKECSVESDCNSMKLTDFAVLFSKSMSDQEAFKLGKKCLRQTFLSLTLGLLMELAR